MNPVEKLRSLWLELRGERSMELLGKLNDQNSAEILEQARVLANLNSLILSKLDEFKPQG